MPRSALLRTLSLLALGWLFLPVSGQHGGAMFSTNKGQWPDHVLYRTSLANSAVFTEKSGLTYVLWSGAPHEHHASTEHHPEKEFKMHSFRMQFVGGRATSTVGRTTQPYYENYFIGKDPTKWASNVPVHQAVELQQLYPGVNMLFKGGSQLKYELHVEPTTSPSIIRMRYEGQSAIRITDAGELLIETSAGTVQEAAPFAYQLTDNGMNEVACDFKLDGSDITFLFPNGYDRTLPLVIDPILTFSTYSGSSADNFGFTATYDQSGHLYGGGIAFGVGYPNTTGVVGPAFNMGNIDMAITKFSPDGSSLIWSTYLGGTESETPHSLVVNSNDELYILGASSSSDFPVSAGAYDNTFNGGTAINTAISNQWASVSGGYGYGHPTGTDIVVAHLSANATTLIGATFIGGTENDGVNNVVPLAYNYGDAFRGEIALDPSERPVIATSTQSPDAPVSGAAPQPLYGGGQQDGYVFRMNPTLSVLEWATFLGGTSFDSSFGLQFDSNGEIFVTGGTTSNDLPMFGTPADAVFNGAVDGYIARYAPTGNTLLSSTYLGTNDYDQSYFVQLNTSDEVFVVGQSTGGMPVSPGKYSNPGSGQFIQKYDHDLTTVEWSTVIGAGNGSVDISPTAFLVSDCGQIYVSGWGGNTNTIAQATNSSTNGLPVTSDAYQATTDGSDFYLMLLQPEATGLAYATYFGGATSQEHVDGGTSRFDKNGNVYQAVCAGCGGNDDFPDTPGVWSPNNGSSNCNLGVFKFNLAQTTAQIGINGPSYICLPGGAQFTNTSSGGTGYLWNFGDGTFSNDSTPFHVYADTGTYLVSMILEDTSGCLLGDTAYLTINVYDPADATISPPDTVCPGGTTQLLATGGYAYEWIPGTGLNDSTIANPIATITADISYSVVVTDSCGSDTVSTTIIMAVPSASAGPDRSICIGDSVGLVGSTGAIVSWSPPLGLSNPNISNPQASPPDTTTYTITVTDGAGCTATDDVTVSVQFTPPMPVTTDTVTCTGTPVQLQVSGGDSYLWNASPDLSALNIPDPVATPLQSTTYYVTMSNLCGSELDSVFVLVPIVIAAAWPNDTICPGDTIPIFASGGATYSWSPANTVLDPFSDNTFAYPSASTTYTVTATDVYGCSDDAQLFIDMFPLPTVDAGPDVSLDFGGSALLDATGIGDLLWSPNTAISCLTCPDPVVNPITSTTYVVTLTDANGCTATDAVDVFLTGTLYVPNTFTPNGDGINDVFFAQATEVREFLIHVFNRWGELIWEGNSPNAFWNGTYKGTESPIDTYVWKVQMTELNGDKRNAIGHVNLVR